MPSWGRSEFLHDLWVGELQMVNPCSWVATVPGTAAVSELIDPVNSLLLSVIFLLGNNTSFFLEISLVSSFAPHHVACSPFPTLPILLGTVEGIERRVISRRQARNNSDHNNSQTVTCFLMEGKGRRTGTLVEPQYQGHWFGKWGRAQGQPGWHCGQFTPFWLLRDLALIKKGREGTVWCQINFHRLTCPHTVHILHLIPNAHSKNSTNPRKALWTPQLLCFSLAGSSLPALTVSGFDDCGPGVWNDYSFLTFVLQ